MKRNCLLLMLLFSAFAYAEEMTIAVLDFTTIDIQGQKFYEYKNKSLNQGQQNTLNQDDLAVIDDRMLGLIRSIDAEENRATRAHERLRNDQEDNRNRMRREALGDKILKSSQRTVIIGADYMRAMLGKYKQFKPLNNAEVRRALKAIEKGRPSNEITIENFRKTDSAQYVLTGTVADFQTRSVMYKGYGITSKQNIYTLDVLFNLAETATGKIVFSGVFSGHDREMITPELQTIDSGRFEKMLKQACSAAAEEMNRCFPAKNNEVKK